MKPNKLKLDPNGPWDPTCWVGDGPAIHMSRLNEFGYRYDAAKKVNAAILRAKRHDSV